MTTETTEIDALVAEPTHVVLESGFKVRVERLRTRGLMALLRILTRGAADVLSELRLSPDESTEEFTGKMIGALILAIPEAEDEVISFVNRMVIPEDLREGKRLSKADLIANDALEHEMRQQLIDPEIDDLVTIISEIVRVEAPHVQALGKRLSILIQAQMTSERSKQGGSSEKSSKG